MGYRREGGYGRGGFRFGGPKPVEVGKEYEVRISEVSRRGDGIARIQGFVIFVEGRKRESISRSRSLTLVTGLPRLKLFPEAQKGKRRKAKLISTNIYRSGIWVTILEQGRPILHRRIILSFLTESWVFHKGPSTICVSRL